MSTSYESADEFSLVEEPFIPGGYPLSALPQHTSSLKSLLPRLWDILSSPSRSPPRPDIPVPSAQSWYSSSPNQNHNQSHSSLFSRNGSPSFSKKQKHRKVPSDLNFITKSTKSKPKKPEESQSLDPENESEIDYTTLPPLDGEEGELIDDEACYFVGFGYGKFANEEVQADEDSVKDKDKESRIPAFGELETRNTLPPPKLIPSSRHTRKPPTRIINPHLDSPLSASSPFSLRRCFPLPPRNPSPSPSSDPANIPPNNPNMPPSFPLLVQTCERQPSLEGPLLREVAR